MYNYLYQSGGNKDWRITGRTLLTTGLLMVAAVTRERKGDRCSNVCFYAQAGKGAGNGIYGGVGGQTVLQRPFPRRNVKRGVYAGCRPRLEGSKEKRKKKGCPNNPLEGLPTHEEGKPGSPLQCGKKTHPRRANLEKSEA